MTKYLKPKNYTIYTDELRRNFLSKNKLYHTPKTIKVYCQEKHILPSTFYGWRKRCKKGIESAVKTNGTKNRITFDSLGALGPK